jgi:hypothetical protein
MWCKSELSSVVLLLFTGSEVYPEVNVQKEKFVIKLKFPEHEEISDLEVGLSSVSKILIFHVTSSSQVQLNRTSLGNVTRR